MKSEMARLFTLRNKFSATSVQVNRAEKGDWPDVKAEIGIEQRRSYLLDHITGATRKPQNPRALAIPLLDRLRGPSVRVLKTQRPQALLANGAYRIEGRNGPLLTQKRNGTAVPVYAFERSAKIKAVLPFEEIVSRAAWTAYSRELRKAFEQAIQPPK